MVRAFSFYFLLSLLPHAALADIHGPICTWHTDPTTTFTLQWIETASTQTEVHAEQSSKFLCHYRKDGTQEWLQGPQATTRPFADTGNLVGFFHLTELKPATLYETRLTQIHEDGRESTFAHCEVRTAPDELKESVRFVVGGDMYQHREALDIMNRRAGKLSPLFALLGGDLAYANGLEAERWYDWLDSWHDNAVDAEGRMIPMIVAIGNHETSGPQPKDAKFFYSLFQLPNDRSNYVVDFSNYMSIVVLDSGHTQPVANQTAWLAKTLNERRKSPHTFCCYHRATFGTLVKPDAVDVRTSWVPLFETYQVTAAFENDHHVYKRSAPIYQGGVDFDKGVLYLGDGAWGAKVREVPRQQVARLPYIVRAESINHLICVTLGPKQRTYQAIDGAGKVFDEYTETVKARMD